MTGFGGPVGLQQERTIVHVAHRDGARIAEVHGELDLRSAPALLEALEHPGQAAIVDLRRCRFVDSSGVAALLGARGRRFKDGYGFAVVTAAGSEPERVFRITGVTTLLAVYPDVEQALSAVHG